MSVLEAYETMSYGPAPESDAEATAWLERHDRRFGLYVGGEWVKPHSKETFESFDPSTTKTLATLAQADDTDVDRAVKAARGALPAWRDLGGHGRARYLYAIARQVQKQSRRLAVLETMDNGKPIRETRDLDVPLVARHFYYHAGWAQLMAQEMPGYGPVGVCGQVIPWNFPLLMMAWKLAPALAMGNTVVLKPAEFTSITALALGEIFDQVGLPPGVVNLITGDGRTGEALVCHDDVDKVAFTGSTDVGKLIRRATAGSGKKLSLELGGKSPFLVFDDADLDSAVEGVVDAIWFNQGQVCCAGSRLLVHEGVHDAMVEKLRARMENLRVGPPLDKAIDIGAIVAPVQLERITALVEQGKAEGATCWQPSWACPKEGWFYPPTLFTGVSSSSVVVREEIFGPVLVMMSFRTPEEAVLLANDTRYGLAASVWTENVNLALDIAPKLQAGVVWVNCSNLLDAAAGFGGYRESGYGREGGREGLREYVKPLAGGSKAGPKKGKKAEEEPAAEIPTGFEPPTKGGARAIDRTAKMYVGGKQARPDGGNSYPVLGPGGRLVGEAGLGNRKDIRNAVEAARKAESWSRTTAHLRAQILYYLGENLEARADEFAERIRHLTGAAKKPAQAEVAKSVERFFTWAAWADKFDGAVHATPFRNVTLAMNEPWGIVAIACPLAPALLPLVSLVAPAIAMGNRVVAVPSTRSPLAATDLYQVFDTSDLPAGVVNLVTGHREEFAEVLARHDSVDSMWYFGTGDGSAMVERESVGNLKATWVNYGRGMSDEDWYDGWAEGSELLQRATRVKNIWVPYGE